MLKATLRSSDGEIASGPLAGKPHLIMTSTGARTGEPREAILSFVRDGEKYVVAGTFSGGPKEPARGLDPKANPVVKFEGKGRTLQDRGPGVTQDPTHKRL